MLKTKSQYFYLIGGVITLIGVILQLVTIVYAPYIFSLGAALLIYFQLQNYLDNSTAELRKMRLARIGLFSSFLLALAAYFMFTNSNLWVLAVLIYALSSFSLSFRGE